MLGAEGYYFVVLVVTSITSVGTGFCTTSFDMVWL